MDEEFTFKRLQGLTREEAEAIFEDVFREVVTELTEIGASVTGGIPYSLLSERTNERLKPYGWSHERLFPIDSGNFS